MTVNTHNFDIANGRLIKYSGFDAVVKIPSGVTSIGEDAFGGAWSVGEIILPDTVKELCDRAFRGCSNLTSVNLPEGLCKIGKEAFSGCTMLDTDSFPRSLTDIGDRAFEDCASLSKLTLCGKNRSIGQFAFKGCKRLRTVSIIGDRLTLGGGAFADCDELSEVSLSGSIEGFGDAPFARCRSLSRFSAPDGAEVNITSSHAFAYCESLREITLPRGTYDIKENAFLGCTSLESVTILADSLIITRGAIPEGAVICARSIPLSGFVDGSRLLACYGYFAMLKDNIPLDVKLSESNEAYAKEHSRDVMSYSFRSESTTPYQLELVAEYYLSRGLLSRHDVESFLESPLLEGKDGLKKSLSDYLETLPKEEKVCLFEEEEPTFERKLTVLEMYLCTREFDSVAELTDAILGLSRSPVRFRETVLYAADRNMLDREGTERLLACDAAMTDLAVKGRLMKYKMEHFGADGGVQDLELL